MDGNFSRVNLKLPNEVKAWIKEEAERNGASMQSYISIILTQYVEKQKSNRALDDLGKITKGMSPEDFMIMTAQNSEMLKAMQEITAADAGATV